MNETESAQRRRKFLEEYSNTLDIKASALAAGFKKRTWAANARNYISTERAAKELRALIKKKAAHLEVCKGYIVAGYLKILDWALSEDDNGAIREPALALRALDSISRQFEGRFCPTAQKSSEEGLEMLPIVSEIKGLDPNKI